MTYRARPSDPSDPSLQSQYMLTNFSPSDVVDDRGAQQVIGTPTRVEARIPDKKTMTR